MSDKKKTPMMELISEIRKHSEQPQTSPVFWMLGHLLKTATELLPAERKMVEDAYDAGIEPYGPTDGSQYFDNKFENR